MITRSVFRAAIHPTDGTVDPGYLGLYAVTVLCLGVIPAAIILAMIRMFIAADHPLDLVGIAAVIAAAGTAFGVAAGGVGLFRMGDKARPAAVGTTTTTEKETVTTEAAAPALGAAPRGTPAKPLVVAVKRGAKAKR